MFEYHPASGHPSGGQNWTALGRISGAHSIPLLVVAVRPLGPRQWIVSSPFVTVVVRAVLFAKVVVPNVLAPPAMQ